MVRTCSYVLLLLMMTPATAQTLDFVTDPEICGLEYLDRQEKGMTFDGSDFWEIEYHCALANPVTNTTWVNSDTHVSAGYCEEPGALFPDVFVVRRFESEPNTLYVYQGDNGEPTLYHNCRQ